MDGQKRPIVWTSFPKEADSSSGRIDCQSYEEQTATVEQITEIPLIENKTAQNEKKASKQKTNELIMKRVLLTLIAGVFIGSLLGASVLKILGLL